MNIQKNNNLNIQNLSFKGHRKTLDKFGYEQHNFYYLYDSSKYKCEVELYNIDKDEKGNFGIAEKIELEDHKDGINVPDGGISLDLSNYDNINLENGFAYRFKLTELNDETKVSYGFDNGTVIGIFDKDNPENKFNVVLNNRAIINKNGPMQLIMPDEFFPGVDRAKDSSGKYKVNKEKREKAEKAVRNHANKLGGQFIGIIKRLPDLQKEGVKRIVGTPFTKDTISSHLYWTENAYQVAPTLGTEADFKELQVELFKNGINWIADAALVNEGFGGIHLSEALRKGDDGTCKSMFRAGERMSLGIIPDKAEEKGFTRMKMINAPFLIADDGKSLSDNPEYNAKKPTYIQFYDSRLASEEQKLSQSPSRLATYDNKNTDNIYDITKHDDAVYPFSIEVSPIELERNVKREISLNGSISLSDGYKNTIKDVAEMKRLSEFSNFSVVNKEKAGGLEVWDGNVDIAKLNFYRSRQDNDSRFANIRPSDRQAAIEAFDRGTLAVRDYAVNSGKYWTQLTADTQLQYVSKMLAEKRNGSTDYMSVINKAIKNGELPQLTKDVVDSEVIENVQDGDYKSLKLDYADVRSELSDNPNNNDYSYVEYAVKKAMDLPLETLPVSTNLLGILTSPYLDKKANVSEELGVSRFDLSSVDNPNLPEEYKATYQQMDLIYSDIAGKILEVVSNINGVKNDNGDITDYGRYVISEIAPDLTKYMFVKALSPNADIKVDENGNFDFSNVNEEDITMQSLGIPYNEMTSKEEAQVVLDVLNAGLTQISTDEIAKVVENRFANRSLDDFRIAEMILDRTESGLGWRIDAAKDIASIDAVRSEVDSIDEAWDNVVDFWKLYNQSVLAINPHAYTTAEITDMGNIFGRVRKEGDYSKLSPERQEARKYKSAGDAERKFLEETGITSIANYNYFFSFLPELFAPNSFQDGGEHGSSKKEENGELLNKLDNGWCPENYDNPGFLFNSPADGVENSYTFFGNHDKPRAIHGLGLDMGLFNSDFKADKKSSYTDKTHRQVAAEVLQKPENKINFDKVNPMAIAMGQRLDDVFTNVVDNSDLEAEIKESVATLASGKHKGSEFDATAFGTRPFDIAIKTVLDETEYRTGKKIPNRENLEINALKEILVPAYDRYLSMYKLLITLPGSPTDFAGDRVGVAGYETKAKNYHQQNRNTIHWEWLDDSRYSFVKDSYDAINEIANLRSRRELSALNDGTTISAELVEMPKLDPATGGPVHKKENGVVTDEIVYDNSQVQSIVRYNNKGSVVVSLHDVTGSSTPLDKVMDRKDGRVISNDEGRVFFKKEDKNLKRGLKFGLEEGMILKNALDLDDPNSPYYKVGCVNGSYYLEKYVKTRKGGNGSVVAEKQDVVIESRDKNTLLLCKV